MKKSFGYILIAVGVLIAINAANPMRFISGEGWIFRSQKVHEEQSLEIGGIRSIQIESGSTDVEIAPGSSDRIQVWLSGKASGKYADKLQLSVEPQGDMARIVVDIPNQTGFGFQKRSLNLHVEVPEAQWKSLAVESSSGDIRLEQVKADQLRVKASSGDLHLEQLKGERITAIASSGDIRAVELEATTVDLHTSSGNITADRYTAGELKFEATSGDVTLMDGQGIVSGHTTSGGIRLEADELTRHTELKGTSGDVVVALSNKPKSLKLEYGSGSGEGKVEWEGLSYTVRQEEGRRIEGTYGTGEVKLSVRTSSGDFKLEKR
ncbi:DUF4097 family beta strand repeat-containing protein [Paenibacillus puerhi]|uniref:DUF4097 family beta strand repeat-containing protein n=1 Tax=Paenibacillus puerhi TaxID=2692622 RepID=UPI00135AD97E|nr:DUF4097 family beta strand repeat-containing protein [Paenibacillus puerhi]